MSSQLHRPFWSTAGCQNRCPVRAVQCLRSPALRKHAFQSTALRSARISRVQQHRLQICSAKSRQSASATAPPEEEAVGEEYEEEEAEDEDLPEVEDVVEEWRNDWRNLILDRTGVDEFAQEKLVEEGMPPYLGEYYSAKELKNDGVAGIDFRLLLACDLANMRDKDLRGKTRGFDEEDEEEEEAQELDLEKLEELLEQTEDLETRAGEVEPPSDPDTFPSTSPEFMPPRDIPTPAGAPPEFGPPGEQRVVTPEQPKPGGRPAPPDRELKPGERGIPDPTKEPERKKKKEDEESEEPQPEFAPEGSAAAGPEEYEVGEDGEVKMTASDEDILNFVQATDKESIRKLNTVYVMHLNAAHGVSDAIEFFLGRGGLPAVQLTHPSGSTATIYLHGANITSWTSEEGAELLHTDPRNPFDAQEPIRGGVQVCWPQYGYGRLPKHGLLQRMHWSVLTSSYKTDPSVLDPQPSVTLVAQSTPETRELYPHDFDVYYQITLMNPEPGKYFEKIDPPMARAQEEAEAEETPKEDPSGFVQQEEEEDDEEEEEDDIDADEGKPIQWNKEYPVQLTLNMQVVNRGESEMSFTSGIAPSIKTSNLAGPDCEYVRMLGLGGKVFFDYSKDPAHPLMALDSFDYTHFGAMQMMTAIEGRSIDRLYPNTADLGLVYLCPGGQNHFQFIHTKGFRDLGVVNPWASDVNAAEFVGVHAVQHVRPVKLAPQEDWVGETIIRYHDSYWPLPIWEREMHQFGYKKGRNIASIGTQTDNRPAIFPESAAPYRSSDRTRPAGR